MGARVSWSKGGPQVEKTESKGQASVSSRKQMRVPGCGEQGLGKWGIKRRRERC